MKRSPLARKTPLSPGRKSLKRGVKALKRARLAKLGARGKRDKAALAKVRPTVLKRAGGRCELCERRARLDLHHVQSRARRPGWDGLHQAPNLRAICRACHDWEHTGAKR